MPELPEVETIARDLAAVLTGRRIEEVAVHKADVIRGVSPRRFRQRLQGVTVERIWRRAKHAVFDLSSGDRLVVQPRFTGGFVVAPRGRAGADYIAVEFTLARGGSFAYRDVRRLGTVSLLDAQAFDRLDKRLGVEPLDGAFTAARLSEFLRSSNQAVKKLLMDQHRIAGVGNIYANEALWIARIDPSKRSRDVPNDAVARLHDAVVRVLSDAIEGRGTTFRDYRDAHGERGEFVDRLAVYGRHGRPCLRCGTRLVWTHAVDQRATTFCWRCQI